MTFARLRRVVDEDFRRASRTLLTATAVVSLVGVVAAQLPLSEVAQKAKAAGRDSVTLHVSDENPESVPWELQFHSVLLVTPQRLAVAQNVMAPNDPRSIVTWHTLRVLEVLHRSPSGYRDWTCDWSLTKPEFASDELPVVSFGGRMVVDGVTITMARREGVELEVGQRYVFLAALCDDRVARLPHGASDLFKVSPDGVLTWGKSKPVPSELRTLERLRTSIQSLK